MKIKLKFLFFEKSPHLQYNRPNVSETEFFFSTKIQAWKDSWIVFIWKESSVLEPRGTVLKRNRLS